MKCVLCLSNLLLQPYCNHRQESPDYHANQMSLGIEIDN